MITIATFNDDEKCLLELYSSSVKERLDVLKTYSETGVKNQCFFGPIYPTIKEENSPEIIDTFDENS